MISLFFAIKWVMEVFPGEFSPEVFLYWILKMG